MIFDQKNVNNDHKPQPSPMCPPVRVWECLLKTHWAGSSKLTVAAPGYSRDSTSYVDGEFLGVGRSTCCFFYPAVLESIIGHGGYHSLVWKPACVPKIQDKPSAVDDSEGWRSRTSSHAPLGFLGGVYACSLKKYYLRLLTLICATSLRHVFSSLSKHRLDSLKLSLCWFQLLRTVTCKMIASAYRYICIFLDWSVLAL